MEVEQILHLLFINKFSASSTSSTLTASSPETKFNVFLHFSSPKFSYPEQPKNTPFDEFLNDDGISHNVEGGLKMNFTYEMQEDNTCKITAKIA